MAIKYTATKAKAKGRTKSKANDQDPPIIIKPGGGKKSKTRPGLTVTVQNIDDGSGPTTYTLGNPTPDGPLRIDFKYTHSEPLYRLDDVTLVQISTGLVFATWSLPNWDDFQIQLNGTIPLTSKK